MAFANIEDKRAYHRDYMRNRYRYDSAHRKRVNAHTAKAAKRRAARIAEMLDEIRATGCVRCGSTDEPHFHHIDPATKVFEIANWRGASATDEQIEVELEKCEILCGPCHRDHHKVFSPCGTRAKYKRGCRCDPCRAAQSEYARKRYRARKEALWM